MEWDHVCFYRWVQSVELVEGARQTWEEKQSQQVLRKDRKPCGKVLPDLLSESWVSRNSAHMISDWISLGRWGQKLQRHSLQTGISHSLAWYWVRPLEGTVLWTVWSLPETNNVILLNLFTYWNVRRWSRAHRPIHQQIWATCSRWRCRNQRFCHFHCRKRCHQWLRVPYLNEL